MGRLLLLGSTASSWREWLKDNRKGRDLLCLDPADAAQSPPGRLCLLRGDKPVEWRFYGGLDAQRAPHVILAALAQLLRAANDDVIVQLFPCRSTPLLRHLTMLVAQIVAPEAILTPANSGIELGGFPVGPDEIELEAAFPEMVQAAQRKAQWMKLMESCTEQEVALDQVCFEGTRLGASAALSQDSLRRAGLENVQHAEASAGTLLLIAREEPDEARMARALDMFHCSRATVVSPDDYADLLCSFARQNGEDFGMGLIQRIDFEAQTATVLSTAVPPAPVRILRIGALRIDRRGQERGELRPWQV